MRVNKAFKLNLKVLRTFGFYPPQKYKQLYKTYAYVLYCLFIVPVPILSALFLLFQEKVDLAQISDNAFIICEFGCVIFKLWPFISNGDEIRKSLYMLECPIFNMYTKRQEDIIEECFRICKRNSRFVFGFYITTFISWAGTPLVGNELKFPVEVWLPFNATSEPKIFIIIYIWIVLGIGSAASCNGVVDPLIAGLAYCATSQIKVLKDNLQNLGDYAEEEIAEAIQHGSLSSTEKESLKATIIYQKIKFCTDHHNAILNFVKIYEKVYSSIVFKQFLASIVVICISCLRMSMVEPFSATFFSMILCIFDFLMEIFMFCYYGTMLYEESDALTNSVYMGKWYDYDMKSKKALMVFMERSQRPITVTAGKILDLSLTTFTTILRRSYSLLAVLKNY